MRKWVAHPNQWLLCWPLLALSSAAAAAEQQAPRGVVSPVFVAAESRRCRILPAPLPNRI